MFSQLSGITVLLMLLSLQDAAAQDYLSLKFSKKNQVRTGLVWIQFKPRLVGVKGTKSFPATKRLPDVALGKLFYTTGEGRVASCSGFFAEEQDVVMTAADCVMTNEGEWNADFLFVHEYGTDVQEVYAIQCAAVPRPWGELNGEAQMIHDYAFLHTTRIADTQTLHLGTDNPPERLTLFGYPDKVAQGRRIVPQKLKIVQVDENKIGSQAYPKKVHSNGAAWISQSRVYSLSIGQVPKKRAIKWGPRFNEQLTSAVTYVSNGCRNS